MVKRFSEEFKHRAVELYLARGNANEISRELGVGRSTLAKWVNRYKNELNPV